MARPRLSWRGLRWLGAHGRVLVALALATSLVAVHAASLGGITSASLLGVSVAGASGAPTILGCDNFTGATNASMSGRAATIASNCASRTWTVHAGTWTIQTNTGASNATAGAAITQNTASATCSVQVTLSAINSGTRSGGVVTSHDGTSRYLAAVMINATPDRVELRLVNGGTSTVLSTVNPTFLANNALRLQRSGSAVTATLNGTVVVSYTLSAAQLTTLGAGTRSGLLGGNANVRFDDFLIITP